MSGKYVLDIFITHWTEPWEIGKKNFDILALQRQIDWNDIHVTLVHDGSEQFPAEYFQSYPFHVRQVCLPHGGIAVSRNWCIDHAEGEWIKWNDFDDMFYSVHSLRCIMDSLNSGQDIDMLWFDVAAEDFDGRRYIKKDRDPVLVHGKCFRTSFLREKGIRFNEDLTWCEDSAFLALLEMEIGQNRIGHMKTDGPVYVWICREGSMCNRDDIFFSNRRSFFRRHVYVGEELRKHGHEDMANNMIVRVLADSYYTLCVADIKEDKSEHEAAVAAYFLQNRERLLKVNQKDFDRVLAAVNREIVPQTKERSLRKMWEVMQDGNREPVVTKEKLLPWLRQLREKYESR